MGKILNEFYAKKLRFILPFFHSVLKRGNKNTTKWGQYFQLKRRFRGENGKKTYLNENKNKLL